FFSIRRRHTIFSRDRSSDVCSSDLSGGERSGLSCFQKRRIRPRIAIAIAMRGLMRRFWKQESPLLSPPLGEIKRGRFLPPEELEGGPNSRSFAPISAGSAIICATWRYCRSTDCSPTLE